MTERSYFWDGGTVGDADLAPYHLGNADFESPFVDVFLRMILNGDENRGVLLYYDNELEVTGVATPVQVDTGAAVIYGMPYENDAALNVAVASPTSGTRIDRIVVRRDWSAQTCRITRIAGTEGGGAPALVQSPAPDGLGIYDIPLARLSITTGGVITVTDEREYCTFSTEAVADSIETSMLVADSATLGPVRATRTKRQFLGGGDLEPGVNAGQFTYNYVADPFDHDVLTAGALPTWGSNAASEEGWQATGTNNLHWYGTWIVPADYASGDVDTYVWWMDDCGAAITFFWYTTYQVFADSADFVDAGEYESTYISDTLATGYVTKSDGIVIPAANLATGRLVNYLVQYRNTAGTDRGLLLGVEFAYTGYL